MSNSFDRKAGVYEVEMKLTKLIKLTRIRFLEK